MKNTAQKEILWILVLLTKKVAPKTPPFAHIAKSPRRPASRPGAVFYPSRPPALRPGLFRFPRRSFQKNISAH